MRNVPITLWKFHLHKENEDYSTKIDDKLAYGLALQTFLQLYFVIIQI